MKFMVSLIPVGKIGPLVHNFTYRFFLQFHLTPEISSCKHTFVLRLDLIHALVSIYLKKIAVASLQDCLLASVSISVSMRKAIQSMQQNGLYLGLGGVELSGREFDGHWVYEVCVIHGLCCGGHDGHNGWCCGA